MILEPTAKASAPPSKRMNCSASIREWQLVSGSTHVTKGGDHRHILSWDTGLSSHRGSLQRLSAQIISAMDDWTMVGSHLTSAYPSEQHVDHKYCSWRRWRGCGYQSTSQGPQGKSTVYNVLINGNS